MVKTSHIGFWAASFALVLGVIYSIFQILTVLSFIDTPYDLIGMFIPSLLLAPLFLITIVCLYVYSPKEVRLFSLIGISFSILYCAFVSLVYFSQLAAIIPLQIENKPISEQLVFRGSTVMVAIDALGYGYMSLATLFTAFSFKKQKGLFTSFLCHGLLFPSIIGSFFFPVLLAMGALWMITFPWAMYQAIKLFSSTKRIGETNMDSKKVVVEK